MVYSIAEVEEHYDLVGHLQIHTDLVKYTPTLFKFSVKASTC